MNTKVAATMRSVALLVVSMLLGAILVSTAARAASNIGQTYEVSGFKVDYPATLVNASEPAEQYATVSFQAAWSGDSFPGLSRCTIDVVDDNGAAVGSLTFTADWPYPGEFPPPPMNVQVNGSPSSAQGHCEAGQYEAGPGYVFDEPAISADEETGGSVAAFPVRWATGSEPATRECVITRTASSGEVTTQDTMINAPQETTIEIYSDLSVGELKDISVTCSEVTAK